MGRRGDISHGPNQNTQSNLDSVRKALHIRGQSGTLAKALPLTFSFGYEATDGVSDGDVIAPHLTDGAKLLS